MFHFRSKWDLLNRVMHGFADVQHGVENDRIPGDLQLVSTGNRKTRFSQIRWLCQLKQLTKSDRLTWWRPPWWICRPPPSRCPSGTCRETAGSAPEEQRREKLSNTMKTKGTAVLSWVSNHWPWRRGRKSRGSRWGSSGSLTGAVCRMTDHDDIKGARKKNKKF